MSIQGEGRFFDLIRCETNDEWLAERSRGIGASDIGAIMGLSKWKSPYEVWLDKTGRVTGDDISGKPVVQFGNDFEEIAGRNYEKTHPGSKVRRVNAMCQSKERPYMRASLDFEVRDAEHDGWGVLEIKTTRTEKDFEETLLDGYTAQVTQQLYVTGRQWGVLWAFFRDTCEYAAYSFERDEEDIAAVCEAADEFWGFVQRDEPPMMVGTQSESAALAGQHPAPSDEMEWTEDESAIDELEEVKAEIKRLEQAKRRIEDNVKARIGDFAGIEGERYRVKWVRSTASKFDRKRYEKEHPLEAPRYIKFYQRDGGLRIKEK